MSKHPHAEIIKALADDQTQRLWARKTPQNRWLCDWTMTKDVLEFVILHPTYEFHLGPTPPPRMIETPFGSYPEPLREAPEQGTELWYVTSTGTSREWGAWRRHAIDIECLRAGLFHLTREAAEQQAQVELKRRMAELGWEKS